MASKAEAAIERLARTTWIEDADVRTLVESHDAQASRIVALEAENARLRETGADASDCLERALGAQRPYSLTRTREIRLALDTLRAALAARGGEVQG